MLSTQLGGEEQGTGRTNEEDSMGGGRDIHHTCVRSEQERGRVVNRGGAALNEEADMLVYVWMTGLAHLS